MKNIIKKITFTALVLSSSLNAAPVGTGFNYQGELVQNGQPVDSPRVFTFSLYDAGTGGNQVGSTITLGGANPPFIPNETGLAVNNGLFNAPHLDFGDQYSGDELWMEITVKALDSLGCGALFPCPVAETLSPRQKIKAVPYAVQADYLGPLGASNGDVLKFSGGEWTPTADSSSTPWTESGSTVSYNGSAELAGTASVHNSNGGLSVGNTAGSHMTIDGDDIQRRVNGSNDPGTMYLNFYGGDVRIASSTNKTVINGDLKQPVDQNGVMKYMVDVFCNLPTATITKSYNGVNVGAITVANSPGGCIIDFPTDINDRFFQATPSFASSGNSTSARAVQCRVGASNNQLLCNYFRPNTGAREIGSFMVLIY